jgi:hypothetical protein
MAQETGSNNMPSTSGFCHPRGKKKAAVSDKQKLPVWRMSLHISMYIVVI